MEIIQNFKCLFLQRMYLLYNAEVQFKGYLLSVGSKVHAPELYHLIGDRVSRSNVYAESLLLMITSFDAANPVRENTVVNSMVQEANDVLLECKQSIMADAVVTAYIQSLLHYLMAGYGTCAAYAKGLGFQEEAEVLKIILREEKMRDILLADLPAEYINENARLPLIL